MIKVILKIIGIILLVILACFCFLFGVFIGKIAWVFTNLIIGLILSFIILCIVTLIILDKLKEDDE